MNLYLIDDFSKEECKTIESKLNVQNSKVQELDDAKISGEEIETVIVLAEIKYNFVSEEFLDFVKFYIKNQLNSLSVKVVFIENMNDNAKIAIDWLSSLKNDYMFNCEVIGEFDRTNLAEEVDKINKILSQKSSSITTDRNDNFVTIYTDGACSGNPGPGGWGAILMHGDHKKEISGFERETTNNQMELTAVIKALESLKAPCSVELFSDSAYVVNAILQGWLVNWINNGWVGSDKKPVKNIELWKRLKELLETHAVVFNKVKGHADNEFNNRCDELATGEIAKNVNIDS